jgi:hypothetical protein
MCRRVLSYLFPTQLPILDWLNLLGADGVDQEIGSGAGVNMSRPEIPQNLWHQQKIRIPTDVVGTTNQNQITLVEPSAGQAAIDGQSRKVALSMGELHFPRRRSSHSDCKS